jgi:hypothetical protein
MCERAHEAQLKHAHIREGGFYMSVTRKTILFVVTLLLGDDCVGARVSAK